MADKQEPDFEILPSPGIKCYLYADGSVILEQYDRYLDNDPNIIMINAQQISTVIEWFTKFRAEFEADNDPAIA